MNNQSDYSKQLQTLARQLARLAQDRSEEHLTEREARNIEELLLTKRLHGLNRPRNPLSDRARATDKHS